MTHLSLIWTVAAVTLLGAMSPGPDFVLVVKNSLSHHRKAGILTGVGVACGLLVHILYSVAGVALLISKSDVLFYGIKLIGALYLIYIGVKSILSKQSSFTQLEDETSTISDLAAFKMGFLSNVLNPKASLFFLGLFTATISPDTPYWVLGVIVLVIWVESAVWFALVSLVFTQKHLRRTYLSYQKAFNIIFGLLLIGLGMLVLFSHK